MWLTLFQQSVVNGPGPGEETTYYLEIALIVLASFLFGYVLRLFLNQKLNREIETLSEENLKLRAENTGSDSSQNSNASNSNFKKDNEKLRQELDKTKAELRLLQMARTSAESEVAELKKKVSELQDKTGEGSQSGVDDLTRIEGIGPKLAFTLSKSGITSFSELADSSEDSLENLLEEAGPAYKILDPSSWPMQAKLAANGQWKELAELQEELFGNS